MPLWCPFLDPHTTQIYTMSIYDEQLNKARLTIYDWCLPRLVMKNENLKDVSLIMTLDYMLKKISLGSIVNTTGRVFVIITENVNLYLDSHNLYSSAHSDYEHMKN